MTLEIGKQNHIINLNDFLYAQSDRVYITLHFKNNSPLLLRTSFTYLETKFPETHFKRINRSDAINPKCITTKTTTTIISCLCCTEYSSLHARGNFICCGLQYE